MEERPVARDAIAWCAIKMIFKERFNFVIAGVAVRSFADRIFHAANMSVWTEIPLSASVVSACSNVKGA